MTDVYASITGLTYEIIEPENLEVIDLELFNINTIKSSCLLQYNQQIYGVSKWVSPKRTRSYPYERVYNTLHISKKITIIPIVKDEGKYGDRDFLQWDTVSLMSLLDVFVIFAYYVAAEKSGKKIKKQKFDNEYVLSKIEEIQNYHSSALHWNLKEVNTSLGEIVKTAQLAYEEIGKRTGVEMHDRQGLEQFKNRVCQDVISFMNFSREKAKNAQHRESITLQPKEKLQTEDKGKLTITNYLGGQYFFTIDEVRLQGNHLNLSECKHSRVSKLPSKGDIKDGLLKLILVSNLSEVNIDGYYVEYKCNLILTSDKLIGEIDSKRSDNELNEFVFMNKLKNKQTRLLSKVFQEARANNFTVIVRGEG